MTELCWAMPDSEACPEVAEFFVQWHDHKIRLAQHLEVHAAFCCAGHSAQLQAGVPLTEWDGAPQVTQVRRLTEDRVASILSASVA